MSTVHFKTNSTIAGGVGTPLTVDTTNMITLFSDDLGVSPMNLYTGEMIACASNPSPVGEGEHHPRSRWAI